MKIEFDLSKGQYALLLNDEIIKHSNATSDLIELGCIINDKLNTAKLASKKLQDLIKLTNSYVK